LRYPAIKGLEFAQFNAARQYILELINSDYVTRCGGAMDMRALVGTNVKLARLKKGLTQEKFAEKSGFSQQYLSSLENGRRNPSIVTIYELAMALGISHVELVQPLKKRRS